jgi:hypothetical protein
MIVVKVELHSAITKRITELARMHICNVGGTAAHGDYDVETLRGRSTEALDNRVVNRYGQVLHHDRVKPHIWYLIAKALKAVNYDKEPK